MSAYTDDVFDHRIRVAGYLMEAANDLMRRAIRHDQSKLQPAEAAIYEAAFPLLQQAEYGTPAYQEALAALGPALQHHYRMNRHHPEHFLNGINDMTLGDLHEMLSDWIAACERKPDGDILKSLLFNKARFNIDDQLYLIMVNTVMGATGGYDEPPMSNEA